MGLHLSSGSKTFLWDHWIHNWMNAPQDHAVIHWSMQGGRQTVSWDHLIQSAWRYAQELLRSGVRPGQVCGLILRHHVEFYPLYLAVSLVGAIPTVLAYPNPRLHPDKFREGLEGMAKCSGLDLVLTERNLEGIIQPLVNQTASSIKQVLFPLEWVGSSKDETFNPEALARHVASLNNNSNPDAPCLLQHSSGTTGLQKGVMLSHRAVVEHLRHYGQAIGISPTDKVATWLPLYHDMGLIAAFHLPLHFGLPIIQLDPFEWVSAPVLLLDTISKEKATLTWLPNFAYNLMADRIHDEDLEGLRLDSLRLAINCSEPVRAESHGKFARRFSSYGLKAEALSACYAMAETTFAVTQTVPGRDAHILSVNSGDLARGKVALATGQKGISIRECVSSGQPILGCQVKIVDGSGGALGDGLVGEIVIQSDYQFNGYRNNPLKTAEVLRDKWYFSGDLGFRHEGEYYIIGRKKDLIIVAGKNLYPEDIEAVVSDVPGVIPGRVVAFGAYNPGQGTEEVCVIAETKENGAEERKNLELAIKMAGMGINITISRIALVPPRWLFKSSSGKPMRKTNQERLGENYWQENAA